jgi:hypothetical protein
MGEERIDHPMMDMPFIGGVPIHQLGISSLQNVQNPDLIAEIKSLHRKLLEVVIK